MAASIEDFLSSSVQKPVTSYGVELRETHWGLALAETGGRASLAETILKLVGLGVFPSVGALVSFSGLIGPPYGFVAKLGILIAFSLVGIALYVYASRGLRRALQVDTSHGVFRLGTKNTQGSFSERQKHSFKKVESIFLVRGGGGAATARLHLRMKDTSQSVFILSGPERVLVPVLERITENVCRLKGNRKARTKTTGRFVHVSFS